MNIDDEFKDPFEHKKNNSKSNLKGNIKSNIISGFTFVSAAVGAVSAGAYNIFNNTKEFTRLDSLKYVIGGGVAGAVLGLIIGGIYYLGIRKN